MERREFIVAAAATITSGTTPVLAAARATSGAGAGAIAVMAELVFPAGTEDSAANALARLAATTRLETGCRLYRVGRDLEHPGRFHLSEIWEDLPSLAAHFRTPHMKEFSAAARKLGFSAGSMKQIGIASIADLNPRALAGAPLRP